MKPLILITNDDGIWADGIKALYHAVKTLGEVWIVAPDTERSAVGHSITIYSPLKVEEIKFEDNAPAFACSGTPADCVKLGVKAILPRKPDIIISGMNKGANTGFNVLYSGTVSAASEGMILGIPSIAFSYDSFIDKNYNFAKKVINLITQKVISEGIPEETLLNVNIPAKLEKDIMGYAVTKQGKTIFQDGFIKRTDPRGKTYYWLGSNLDQLEDEPNSDTEMLKKGYVSISPIQYNLTNAKNLQYFSKWDIIK
jgi:5'-nucleotidase